MSALPIHTRLVLGPRGARSVTLTVFCPHRQATASVDTCERCPRLEQIAVSGDRPMVVCRAEMSPHELAGSLIRSAALCVTAEAPLDALDLSDGSSRVTPVVDEFDRYVGSIVQGRSSTVPPPLDSARDLLRGLATAADAMERVPPVNEHDDALAAAATMISSRARCVPVVDDRNVVVGLLDDIALLGSVARAHGRWR